MTPDGARHGTRFGYRDDRCRCEACKKAIALEHNVYKMRRTANGGRPLSVDKLGSVRRLHALMALGWPRRELARQAGYTGDAFAPILNGARQRITLASAKRVADLYERLSMTRGPSNPARIAASKRGYAPPLAWTNIDDPNELPDLGGTDDDIDPVVVDRLVAGWPTPSTHAEKCEAMRRWLAMGKSEASLCLAHGWRDGRYVEREEGAA